VKRIAAIVLPEIACELVRAHELPKASGAPSPATSPKAIRPFAVIVDDEWDVADSIDQSAILDAVDPDAWRYGARPGQSAAEAAAFVGQLTILRLATQQVEQALGSVAEIALGFGTTAALSLATTGVTGSLARSLPTSSTHRELARLRYPLGSGAGPFDTVWLDVTGCSRLVGGEDILCADLRERAQQLGHRARIAIAGGPRIAQAIARWKHARQPDDLIVPPGQAAQCLAELPIAALPIKPATISWLGKLGILRVDDLARLDRARLAHRLGPQAQDLLALIAGQDDAPLHAYQPPRLIAESATFEHEISGAEPLSFVLNGLTSRAVNRLCARGQACTLVSLTLTFDRAFVDLQNRDRPAADRLGRQQRIDIELPVALARQEELMAALRAKLERLELPCPVVAVELTLDGLTSQTHAQLNISRLDITKHGVADPNALPTLLAELGAGLGTHRVGVLSLGDSHRPEARSKLVPADPYGTRPLLVSAPSQAALSLSMGPLATGHADEGLAVSAPSLMLEPTRILPQPIEIGRLEPDALIGVKATSLRFGSSSSGGNLYRIDRLELAARFDRVQWWTSAPVCRDYAHAWLRTGERNQAKEPPEMAEAWVYIERTSGRGFIHGWYE